MASYATSTFAVVIGEFIARLAVERRDARHGPIRAGAESNALVRPLERAAANHPPAAEALVAALALLAYLDGPPR